LKKLWKFTTLTGAQALDGNQMKREIINRVEVLDTGELPLGIKGQGNPSYQYVYREASGVYWDENRKGFKSTPMKKWSRSKWFDHIVKTALASVGVRLKPGSNVSWINISDEQKSHAAERVPRIG
jgi:hypothetical protein